MNYREKVRKSLSDYKKMYLPQLEDGEFTHKGITTTEPFVLAKGDEAYNLLPSLRTEKNLTNSDLLLESTQALSMNLFYPIIQYNQLEQFFPFVKGEIQGYSWNCSFLCLKTNEASYDIHLRYLESNFEGKRLTVVRLRDYNRYYKKRVIESNVLHDVSPQDFFKYHLLMKYALEIREDKHIIILMPKENLMFDYAQRFISRFITKNYQSHFKVIDFFELIKDANISASKLKTYFSEEFLVKYE